MTREINANRADARLWAVAAALSTCGPQKSRPAGLKWLGVSGMARSAGAKRRLDCAAGGSRPGRVVCACVSVAQVAAGRGAVPASATRSVRGARGEAAADRCCDASELDDAVAPIQVAVGVGGGAPADADPLAPGRLQAFLEVEVSRRTAAHPARATAADPTDGAGESAVGSGADRE